jgi:hypothetical protein
LGVIVWQPKVCSSLFVELKFACLEFIYVEWIWELLPGIVWDLATLTARFYSWLS